MPSFFIIGGGGVKNINYERIQTAFASLALGYFFFFSGYVMYLNTNPTNCKAKQIKYLKSLGLPLCIWNSIVLIMIVVVSRKIPFSDIRHFILGYSLNPWNAPTWYMFVLLILVPFLWPLVKIKSNIIWTSFLGIIYLLAFFLSGMGIILKSNFVYRIWLNKLITYLPAFFTGAYIASVNPKFIQAKNKTLICFVGFISALTLIAICEENSWYIWVINRVFPLFLWYSIPDYLFNGNTNPEFRILPFFVYVLHDELIFWLLYRMYNCFTIQNDIITVIIHIMIPLICVGISFLFIFFMSKRKVGKKILDVLCGGRYRNYQNGNVTN